MTQLIPWPKDIHIEGSPNLLTASDQVKTGRFYIVFNIDNPMPIQRRWREVNTINLLAWRHPHRRTANLANNNQATTGWFYTVFNIDNPLPLQRRQREVMSRFGMSLNNRTSSFVWWFRLVSRKHFLIVTTTSGKKGGNWERLLHWFSHSFPCKKKDY